MPVRDTNKEIEKLRSKFALFAAAERGEAPVCPKCKSGRIIVKVKGRVYECDNRDCGLYWSLYKGLLK